MQVPEAVGLVRITIERTDLPVSRTIVDYRTEGATALPGSDYEESAGTLVFEVGETAATFTVPILDDTVPEGREHFVIRLVGRSSPGAWAPLTILDDDRPADTGVVAPGGDDQSATELASSSRSGGAAPAANAVAGSAAIRTTPRVAAPARPRLRQVIVRQSPSAPFELRAAAPPADSDSRSGYPGRLDPLLATLAGLVFARVAAELWFRVRMAVV